MTISYIAPSISADSAQAWPEGRVVCHMRATAC